MWKRLISLSLTFGLAAAAPPAAAQTFCGPYETVSHSLVADFGETRIGRGLESATSLFEIWRSKDKGSWTIIRLDPNGRACVMASGSAWIDEDTPLPTTLTTWRY